MKDTTYLAGTGNLSPPLFVQVLQHRKADREKYSVFNLADRNETHELCIMDRKPIVVRDEDSKEEQIFNMDDYVFTYLDILEVTKFEFITLDGRYGVDHFFIIQEFVHRGNPKELQMSQKCQRFLCNTPKHDQYEIDSKVRQVSRAMKRQIKPNKKRKIEQQNFQNETLQEETIPVNAGCVNVDVNRTLSSMNKILPEGTVSKIHDKMDSDVNETLSVQNEIVPKEIISNGNQDTRKQFVPQQKVSTGIEDVDDHVDEILPISNQVHRDEQHSPNHMFSSCMFNAVSSPITLSNGSIADVANHVFLATSEVLIPQGGNVSNSRDDTDYNMDKELSTGRKIVREEKVSEEDYDMDHVDEKLPVSNESGTIELQSPNDTSSSFIFNVFGSPTTSKTPPASKLPNIVISPTPESSSDSESSHDFDLFQDSGDDIPMVK